MSGRYHLLDALRGIASLAVVVWHYQHFAFQGVVPDPAFDAAAQPFFGQLAWLYRHGSEAVQLFFVLSGFLFFGLYEEALRSRRLGPWPFFVLRFSRIYPLALATLLAAALIQHTSKAQLGHFLITRENDARHFLLHLGLASHWGLQDGWAYNGPAWSISIEVLLYLSFYVIARTLGGSNGLLALVAAGALHLSGRDGPASDYWTGLLCFIMGGFAFRLSRALAPRLAPGTPRGPAFAVLGTLAVLVLGTGMLGARLLPDWDPATIRYAVTYPGAITALALVQGRHPGLGRRFRWLGDLSYAVYLLHVPLQMAILLGAGLMGLTPDYRSPLLFAGFLAGLLGLSALTYYGFERPAQRALRARFLAAPAV